MIFDYIDGGAEDEVTLRDNRSAFEDVRLSPRMLVDVGQRNLGTTLLGQDVDIPILLAPIGLARLAGKGGDIAAARAAEAAGTVAVLSSASSDSLEAVADASQPTWFQLYPWINRGVTEQLMARAKAAGYRTLCVTVDVPTMGGRERDLRQGLTVPPRVSPRTIWDVGRHPRWWLRVLVGPRITFANLAGIAGSPSGQGAVELARFAASLNDPSNSWDDLEWIRERWEGPLVVKGILRADDAAKVVDLGGDGIVVSNHGGRQLDGAPATLEVLPEIKEAIQGKLQVFLDGGVRRGTDVVKALALGADAVLIGRPWLWALSSGGESGIRDLLRMFRQEMDRAMVLVGCPSVRQLGPEYVRPRRGAVDRLTADGLS